VQVLLVVRHVLAEWPTPYVLAQPVQLPKNTELAVNGYYDQDAAVTRESLKLTVSLYNNRHPARPGGAESFLGSARRASRLDQIAARRADLREAIGRDDVIPGRESSTQQLHLFRPSVARPAFRLFADRSPP